MALVQLSAVTKEYGARKVLDAVTLEVHEGEKIGLIGVNGSGKTSLLRIIEGELEADLGEIRRAKDLRIGYLPQIPDFTPGNDVLEEAMRVFDDVARIEARLRALEDEMHAPRDAAHLQELVEKHGRLHEEFEHKKGWQAKSRCEAALAGLGLAAESFGKKVESLSGGEKNRLALAKLLLSEPDLLLLDEPTNFLDLEATTWLEEFLREAPEAVIVISHDRWFLDRVTTRIVEVERATIESYRGNYSAYAAQKALRLETERRAFQQQQAFIAKEEEFIRRNIAGQNTKIARGRRTRLARLERVDRPIDPGSVKLAFDAGGRGGDVALDVKGLAKSFGERTLFSGVDLRLLRGERLGIIGPNGAGKTTLLRVLRGEIAPDAGTFKLGVGVQASFYDQEHKDLDLEATVFDAVRERASHRTDEAVRSYLGAFLFTKDDVFKKVGSLSGGERSRVALARIILSKANLLVLDEPTNHLDIPSRTALEESLDDYDGTLIVVSHDRFLLDRVVDRLLVLGHGEPQLFAGTYSDYHAKRQAEAEAARVAAESAEAAKRAGAKAAAASSAKGGAAKKKKRPVETIEKLIMQREEAIARLHEALGREENFRSAERMRQLQSELESNQSELRALEREWEEHAT
ncbi:MAG: ABC-F family ATP-binding cassette domain-containing protein [Planctomycetes bacterium]|nr:ABC-F family ATP-binding cassette domain-containing protein [Planctomycetota bacterium]